MVEWSEPSALKRRTAGSTHALGRNFLFSAKIQTIDKNYKNAKYLSPRNQPTKQASNSLKVDTSAKLPASGRNKVIFLYVVTHKGTVRLMWFCALLQRCPFCALMGIGRKPIFM